MGNSSENIVIQSYTHFFFKEWVMGIRLFSFGLFWSFFLNWFFFFLKFIIFSLSLHFLKNLLLLLLLLLLFYHYTLFYYHKFYFSMLIFGFWLWVLSFSLFICQNLIAPYVQIITSFWFSYFLFIQYRH